MQLPDGSMGHRVQLRGEPLPGFLSMEEVIRPFATEDRGITFLDGQQRNRLSYAELAGRTHYVAGRLRGAGVAPGDRVAMTLTNDLESVLILLGTWMRGGTAVSLPPPGRGGKEWYTARFGAVLRAMGCEFIVASGDLEAGRDGYRPARSLPREDLLDGTASSGDTDTAVPRHALIQFTSGSVTAPKGVTLSATALAGHLASLAHSAEIDPATDKFVSWLPLYHDMGLIAMFLQALGSRAEQVLMRPRAFVARPASWLRTLSTEGGTITAAPNFAYRMAASVPYPEGTELSGIGASINGGERVDWGVVNSFYETGCPLGLTWGAVSPCYGLAEAAVGVTYTKRGQGPRLHPSGHVSVGSPMPGMSLAGPDGPPAGPIAIAGPSLFDGYHTVDGFTCPVTDGWFDTGDEGFIVGGDVYISGRRTETVSVAGHNVFAEDIESAVHEKGGELVRACAAFRLKEFDQKFGLMVEVSPQAVRAVSDIPEFAGGLLAAVTEAVGIRLASMSVVRIGTIPRTTSGKVQRAECREMYASALSPNRLLLRI
jgi:fatty-acyl-CoA synthase